MAERCWPWRLRLPANWQPVHSESGRIDGWSCVTKLRDLTSPGPATKGGFGLRVEDSGVGCDVGFLFLMKRREKGLPAELLSVVLMCTRVVRQDSYLVDPASSHMLVSKIKPCMS